MMLPDRKTGQPRMSLGTRKKKKGKMRKALFVPGMLILIAMLALPSAGEERERIKLNPALLPGLNFPLSGPLTA